MKSTSILLPRPAEQPGDSPRPTGNGEALYRLARRVIIFVLGMSVLLVGIIMTVPFVPGPGIIVIPLALAILATEFVWARRILDSLKKRLLKRAPPAGPSKP